MIQTPPRRNPTKPNLYDVINIMDRIESKLDVLIAALSDEVDELEFDLDGNELPAERDQSESL